MEEYNNDIETHTADDMKSVFMKFTTMHASDRLVTEYMCKVTWISCWPVPEVLFLTHKGFNRVRN